MSGRIPDFIFGKTSFFAEDGFCDEFLSEAGKSKIVIYELKRTGNSVGGYIYYHDRKKIADAAEKSGMNLTFTGRYGLPHIALRYRKRFGIPVGVFVFTLITLILHSGVWSIDISGLESIPQEKIENILFENGIKSGVFCDTLNCKEIEYVLYNTFDDISWVNVHITGTRMFIDVSEVKEKEHLKTHEYSNIVASKDGEIVTAEIFTGEGKLYPGTAVVRGDLLVSGIVNHRDGSVKFVDSEAEIFARTKNFISSLMPMKFTADKLIKCKDIYFLEFFGVTTPLSLGVKSNNFTGNRYFLSNDDIIFPVGVVRNFDYVLQQSDIELTELQAKLICLRDFSLSALKLYENAEILEQNISFSAGESAEICGEFLCIEDIALKKTFTVEEN